jgi:ankyrin repeat protein
VKLLLDTGKVDADSKDTAGWRPLSHAAQNGHEGIVKLLLDTGKVGADSKDVSSWTPLSYAAQNGHEGIIKLLQSAGASVQAFWSILCFEI